ncbi:copper homeostasis protein CutC [Paenibacillus chungangensis]|uniref:PF03932 family protein CutC n=1 Tax=Paenibacillus chungangensis TaxID=696535 RepID=A0ABW3HKB8_9BACL
MIVEIIAITPDDVAVAAAAGADRIELVSGIAEGGLTPSAGLIEAAVQAAAIPVNVMIRPHSQSFRYNEADQLVMLRDIEVARAAGAAGIVIGLLNDEGEIDRAALERMLAAASGMDVTFHRAFDELQDQADGLRVLSEYKAISRVLTAGGLRPAPESCDQLRMLQELSAQLGGPRIMGGYGLNADNAAELVKKTGVPEVHFGSGARLNGSFQYGVDVSAVERIRSNWPMRA